ncbi:hypothetical protein JB92DRAFT_3136619 [Gautieria morchelliformis]|nr:hypothetical protein JB92DRAFT_3136619 [Gautieria morchelliformis]
MAHQHPACSSSSLPYLKSPHPFTFVVPASSNPFADIPRMYGESKGQIPTWWHGRVQRRNSTASPSALLGLCSPDLRPNMSILRPTRGPASAGSSYPLSAFAKLSWDRSEAPSRLTLPRSKHALEVLQTLAPPYTLQEHNVPADPQVWL